LTEVLHKHWFKRFNFSH